MNHNLKIAQYALTVTHIASSVVQARLFRDEAETNLRDRLTKFDEAMASPDVPDEVKVLAAAIVGGVKARAA